MTRLHDQNPVGRFSDRAGDYVKYRPTYPAEAIDAILDGLGPAERLLTAASEREPETHRRSEGAFVTLSGSISMG
jgi:hypothetical protein